MVFLFLSDSDPQRTFVHLQWKNYLTSLNSEFINKGLIF